GEALWKLLTPRFRSEVDNRAAQVRRAAASDLHRLFGYQGPPQEFKGLAYLRAIVKGGESPTNPCLGAERWTVSPADATSAAGYIVQRGDDYAMGLKFITTDGGWRLDQMSKWMRDQ